MGELRLRAVALLAAAGLLIGPTAAVASHEIDPEVRELLRELQSVTEQYRDVSVAEADGYALASPCESDPKYGAMGFHYVNQELIEDDNALDPMRPEILVYHRTKSGELRLGAVEYFTVDADQDLHTNEDRPTLFGVPFDGPMLGHSPGMPIHYDLHVWLDRKSVV